MSYPLGSIKKKTAKDGKEYFAGFLGRFPVTGFWGTKNNNQNVMYFSLDHEKAKYLDEQEKKKKEGSKPQEETKQQ